MSKRVYKSANSERMMKELYDRQLAALNIEYEDLYIGTRYGKTHLVKTGNPEGKPVLLFHGGNSTTPYYLKDFIPFRKDCLIYAVDTMGHPGKSAQTVLSSKNLEYGYWAADVIDGLGFEKMICIGGSFGGGVLVKLMCVAPAKISKAVLLVPSAISNVSTASIMFKMGIPMMMYIITQNKKWLQKTVLSMAIDEREINERTLTMVEYSFNHVCIKAGMPSNVSITDLDGYTAPTLLIAGEKDVMFPGERVIARAEKMIPNLKTHLAKGSGHMLTLSSEKYKYILEMIADFLAEF